MQKIKSGIYSKDDIPRGINGVRRNDISEVSSRLVANPQTVIRRDFDLPSSAGNYIASLNTIIRRDKASTIKTCRRNKTVFIFSN